MDVSEDFAREAERVGLTRRDLLEAAWRSGCDIEDLAPLTLVADRLDEADLSYLMRHSMNPATVLALLDMHATFAQVTRIHASGELLRWAQSLLEHGMSPDDVVTIIDANGGLLAAMHMSRVRPPLSGEQMVEVLGWDVSGLEAAEFLTAGGTLSQLKSFAQRGLDVLDVAYAWPVLPSTACAELAETFAVLVSGAVTDDRIARVPAEQSRSANDLLAAAVAFTAPPRIRARSRGAGSRSIS